MSITYAPDPSPLVELAIAAEVTYGTYVDPTVGNSGVQIALVAAPDFGRGHEPIQGAAMTSTVQSVSTHRSIRGLETPYVNFEAPFSANSLSMLFHMIFGTILTGGTWAVANDPTGFSIGVNVQRPGATGGDYFKFAGCRVATARIVMPIGGMPTVQVACVARSLANPDTAPTAFPTLAPTTTYRPFILQDATLKNSATSTFSGSAVKIRGFEMNIDAGLLVEHNSSALSPDHIIRTAFDVTGVIGAHFSADWWDEWKAIIEAESGLGHGLRYAQFLLNDGTNTLRLVLPMKITMPSISPDGRAMDASLAFTAFGDDTAGTGGAPTVAAIKATNS